MVSLPLLASGLLACGDDGISEPAVDYDSPSAPVGLAAVATSSSQISLTWTASTDNVAVTGYKLYRDEVFVKSISATSTSDAERTPRVRYCYAVSAYDAAGNESLKSSPACVATTNQDPAASFVAPASALAGVELTFDASASADPDGAIASFAFNFGDGSPVVSQSGPLAKHTYASKGTYNVTLTVTDNHGAAGYSTGQIIIRVVVPPGVNISKSPTLSQGQSFFADRSGIVYVTWDEFGSNIAFSRSKDDGRTFDAPKYVIDPNGPLGSANGFYSGVGQKRIAGAGDEVHIAWTIFDVFYGLAEVLHIRSSDGGATFTDLKLISSDDGVNSTSPAIAIEPSGVVGVAWADGADGVPGVGVFYRSSTDGGATFGSRITLASSGFCPAIALSSQNVYAVWGQGEPALEHLLFARSTDGGSTFSTPIVLDVASEKSWCPVIALGAAGHIYLVWEEGEVLATRILFTRSTDGGASFTSPVTLSPPGVHASCPSIAASEAGAVHVTWSQADPYFTQATSYLVSSADGGMSFSAAREIPTEFANVGCYQVIARPQNRAGLGWHAPPIAGALSDVFYRSEP